LPQFNGAINIRRRNYVYEELVDEGSQVRLVNLSAAMMPNTLTPFPLTVEHKSNGFYTGDFIVLSPRNHIIIPTGTSESVSAGGNLDEAVTTYDQYTIKPGTRKPHIEFEEEPVLDAALRQLETSASFIAVDEGQKTVDIGGGYTPPATTAFGAAWYDEDKTIGGDVNFCQAGKCKFGLGIRAFFTLDYSGDGDGITFALLNAFDNGATSVGGDIELSELLGYAGDSRTDALGTTFLDGTGNGLEPPKIAVEFDTRTNNDTLIYCADATTVNQNTRNDPLTNNKDAVQYIFWGNNTLNIPCRGDDASYDDNQHNAGESNENWSFGPTGADINSTPAVGADGTIYVGSNDGNVHAINPDGTAKGGLWPFATGGAVISSPAVGADGTIYVGSNDRYVYAINPDATKRGEYLTGGAVRSSPAIGSDGTVYIGSDDWKVYAFTPTLTIKWEYQTNQPGGAISLGRPAIGPTGTIYVAAADANIYALDPDDRLAGLPFPTSNEWTYNLVNNSDYAPGVDSNSGTIYSDASAFELVAINPDGSEKWRSFLNADIDSTPAVAADGTIYVGSDQPENSLFALEPVNGNVIWKFVTGNEVDTSPAIDSEGTIYIVSNDDNLYAVNPDGTEKWRFPIAATDGDVNSSPTFDPNTGIVYVGSDDHNLYAINRFALPRNFKDEDREEGYLLTSEELDASVTVDNPDDWLKGDALKGPWAIRLELKRSLTTNTNGNYDYTLRTWIRQCDTDQGSSNCTDTDIIGTFFQDTRIEYDAKTPHLAPQPVELSPGDHVKFERLLFGFTGATGVGTSQNAIIGKFQLSFIRPGDPVISTDPNWP
jgi:outer membrane protein assembly factor BamB